MKKIISLILCIFFLLTGCSKSKVETKKAQLYFVNTDKTEMIVEERDVELKSDVFAEDVVRALLSGPSGVNARRVLPEDAGLLDVKVEGRVALVNMSRTFDVGEDADRLLGRYTLISTVCSIQGIDKTKILVEGREIKSITSGKPLEALGKEDIVLPGGEHTNDLHTVSLYFADENAMLKKEIRQVKVEEGNKIEKVTVEEIIKGPSSEKLYPTVMGVPKVLDTNVREGVCFVNLSQEFVTANTGGSGNELLAVYSIVNSLCEFDNINKVQFLIEGKSEETFGQLMFNEAFDPQVD